MAENVEIPRLIQQYKELERRVTKLEGLSEYQQKEITQVLESQASNKAEIQNLIRRIDGMEKNILARLANRQPIDLQTMNFLKWVLSVTIVSMVGAVVYLIYNSGGGI